MTEDVDIKVNADGGSAQKALEQIAASFDKIADRGRKTSQQVSEGMGKWVSDAGKVAAGMLGVQSVTATVSTALGVLRAEIDAIIQRQQRASNRQVSLAQAQEGLAFVSDTGTFNQVTARIGALARRIGGADTARMLSIEAEGVLSGRGSLSQDTALATLEAAARARPGLASRGGVGAIAEAALAVQKAQPGVSPEQAVANVFATGMAARNTSIESTARNLIPAASQMRAMFGGQDDLSVAQSILVGFGQRGEDPTGERTGTNTLQLMKQLKIRAAQSGSPNVSLAGLGSWAQTTEGRRAVMELLGPLASGAASEEEIGQFGQRVGLTGEARSFQSAVEYLRSLLGEQTPTGAEIATARGKIGLVTGQENIAALRAATAELGRSGAQQTATAVRKGEGALAAMESDPLLVLKGTVREAAEQAMEAAQRSYLTKFGARRSLNWELGTASTEEQVREIGARFIGEQAAHAFIEKMNADVINGLADLKDAILNQRITIEVNGDQYEGTNRATAERAGR